MTTVTLTRESAQDAVDALKHACNGRCNAEYNPCWQRVAADSLQSAIEAPELTSLCGRCHGEGLIHTGMDESPTTMCESCDGTGTTPPAPQAPARELTIKEIGGMWVSHVPDELSHNTEEAARQLLAAAIGFARAVLAASKAKDKT